MQIDPQLILKELKDGATTRTQASLDKLNGVLCKHYEAGEKDFCIATIGRLSVAAKGPSTVTIRNKSGAHYRRLIEAWATKAGTDMKKPLASHSRQREVPSDTRLLERLDDPALRALFGQIIAERNRYKKEVNLLKQQADIVIDKRPIRQANMSKEDTIEVLPSLSGVLTEMEIIALRKAISEEFFAKWGWKVTKAGQVKCEEYGEIYPRGYVNAIKKVLGEIE